ncbi:MAG: winged helix-turn-helix domain-containing protein [Candidatus Syntrophoarchaeum sp.]|nr:winged helix-turn-helix domain-containing protein [Methanomicrobia archaeon]MBL7117253.1 winged helix-turn-helix domain-containing protein [Candidatus Syntrophoarchaeum sp.]
MGTVAGEIWHLLKERDELSISGVVSEINASQSTAYMGLGWLAREDKLEFAKKSRGVFVRLK